MLNVSVLVSGSKGNSTLVCTDDAIVLVDAGVSYKKTAEMLEELRINPQKIDAIVISHEHTDHVGGAGVLSRKIKAPIYITRPTMVMSAHKIGKLPVDPVFFDVGDTLQIKNMRINTFTSSHDAVDSSNFLIYNEEKQDKKLVIATDLGYAPQILINKLKLATTIVLESNHDVDMLMNGIYDWDLKQRVKSRKGHLSNEQAVGIISTVLSEKLDRVILAHLSEQNNCPKMAYNLMNELLKEMRAKTQLSVASQTIATPLFEV
ncbi:MAG: MBL fold metallo-hydrolase [Candidatus Cloacimonadales bacterium]|nr:MBL fold metallo-hydrolase [Candidatus Cloacimonadota bacterium]